MIRVIIVDDSPTAREVLSKILEKDPEIKVVGTAPDAYIGRDKIVTLKPDMVCLDVEMPRMDGIAFLRKIMQYMPVPVLMVSSLTQKGASVTLDALEAGAVDFVGKPHRNMYEGIDLIERELIAKVKMVASSNLSARKQKVSTNVTTLKKHYFLGNTTNKLIAIGASTGGTVALGELLKKFPRDMPGIVIVQHMPKGFTNSFAQRLNEMSAMEVAEAQNGDIVGKGKVLIAPGDCHMVLRREGGHYVIKLGTGEKVSGHRPSVDLLFNSCAKYAGANCFGILLTGMGSDGAKGLLKMRHAGAVTLGQDEKSCVVYGMPKVAFEIGAVEQQLGLDEIVPKVISLLRAQ